ncbi:protein of unknown function [Paraburkholderia dioscoreae]|uniref:Uncharacterized protein n=1 Tax=Paraburkholderia dioscoreae TaxID=2604047 RepID=A0A5Q4Z1P4_9BURK|nr:protein of unknown function [Paraburkholderia dioscoreae]
MRTGTSWLRLLRANVCFPYGMKGAIYVTTVNRYTPSAGSGFAEATVAWSSRREGKLLDGSSHQ